MSPINTHITTHILDTAIGKPAAGIDVTLEFSQSGSWGKIASGTSNADGRIPGLLPDSHLLRKGQYRIRFELERYFSGQGRKSFYPHVEIAFTIEDPAQHYHVPLLVSGYGYSTYRGS